MLFLLWKVTYLAKFRFFLFLVERLCEISRPRILLLDVQSFPAIGELDFEHICFGIYVFAIQIIFGQLSLLYRRHFHQGLIILGLLENDDFLHISIFAENRKKDLGVHRKFDICDGEQKYITWWGCPVVDYFGSGGRLDLYLLIFEVHEALSGIIHIFKLYKSLLFLAQNQHFFNFTVFLQNLFHVVLTHIFGQISKKQYFGDFRFLFFTFLAARHYGIRGDWWWILLFH